MRAAAIVLLLAACKPSSIEVADRVTMSKAGCLELPAASRRALRSDGNALYWIERVRGRDFSGNQSSFDRLVRYDFAARRVTALWDWVTGPYHFMEDGGVLVVVQWAGNPTLMLLRDGQYQQVLPEFYLVKDIEPIDAKSVAILAEFDAKRGIHVLDLGSPRPYHLADADLLLSVAGGRVFAKDADGGFALELRSQKRTSFKWVDGSIPEHEFLWSVEDSQLHARSMITDESKTEVSDTREWKILYQDDSALARFAPASDRTHSFLLANGKATRLPTLTPLTSFVGAVEVGADTWTLVGHNTSNYDGDLFDVTHEADVCRIDAKKPSFEYVARNIPSRFAAKGTTFSTTVGAQPKSTWQVLDYDDDSPVTVFGKYDEDGGADLDALRERARTVHKTITSLLDDKETITSLEFNDGRTAVYRWRRDRLRGRASAGIGDILLTDPIDFDVQLDNGFTDRQGDKILCSGKLTNLRGVQLQDVHIRCIGSDRTRVIAVKELAGKQSTEFKQTFDAKDDDVPLIEVFRDRNQLVVRDMKNEATMQALYDFAVSLHAQRGFAVVSRISTERFYVLVLAPKNFALDDIARVKAVYDDVVAKRALFNAPDGHELELQVLVGRFYYDFNGDALVPVK